MLQVPLHCIESSSPPAKDGPTATVHQPALTSTEASFVICALGIQSTVFASSNNEVLGSNPTRDMYDCVCLFCVSVVLCVSSGLATGWSPAQGLLPTAYRNKNIKKAAKASTKGYRAIVNNYRDTGLKTLFLLQRQTLCQLKPHI
jgi:hypothetical protein